MSTTVKSFGDKVVGIVSYKEEEAKKLGLLPFVISWTSPSNARASGVMTIYTKNEAMLEDLIDYWNEDIRKLGEEDTVYKIGA